MSNGVECPQCGKVVKRLGAHLKFCPGSPEIPNMDEHGFKPPEPPKVEKVEQPGSDRAIEQLLGVIQEQQKAIREQGAKLEAMGKDFGDFAKSIVERFNDVPKTVSLTMRAELDQIAADFAQGKGFQPPPAPPTSLVTGQPPQPGGDRGGMMDKLFPVLAQAFANSLMGGQQNNPMAAMQQIGPLVAAMQAIAQMQMAPFVAGGKMVADMITLGTRSGLTPEASSAAAGKVISDMVSKQPEAK